jgi:dihydroflavonol-4-reductase
MLAAVTGGAGRLGNVLVRALLERGDGVRVLEPGDGPVPSLDGLDVALVRGSVLDQGVVRELVRGADVVFHLAAKVDLARDEDGSVFAVNVEGTRRVARACLETGARLVHVSSHHALVREPLDEPLDERKPLAINERCDYHRAKAIAERLLLDAVAHEGLDAVVCSPGTMIGPHDYEPSMIGRALLDVFHGKLPALMEVVSDYVDARDVAQGLLAAVDRGRRGERYLLSGEVLTMREMAGTLGELTRRPIPRVVLPLWAAWALLPASLAAARITGKPPLLTEGVLRASSSNRIVRHEKAAAELGFSPRPVAESLGDAFDWYREQGWLEAPPPPAHAR